MRCLLLLLFCSTTLFAQTKAISSDKYVWAKSGLTLRAEGNPKGKKIAIIPYGATVQLTGEWGEDLSLKIIPERMLDDKKTLGWNMLGQYIGISYEGQQGYAFSGYVSSYNPHDLSLYQQQKDSLSGFQVVDTLHFLKFSTEREYGEQSVLYRNGITESSYWDKAGGGGTYVVPNATLANGYLLAAKLFELDAPGQSKQEWQRPCLINKEHDSLTFQVDLLEVTIKEYFGVIIITWDIHC